MAPHEQRLHLYEESKNLYSDEAANDLMSGLLPVGWSDLATHDDLAVEGAALRAEMADLGGTLGIEMADLRTELRTGIAGLGAEMGIGFADLRTEMHKSYMSVLRWCTTIMVSLTAIFVTLVWFR